MNPDSDRAGGNGKKRQSGAKFQQLRLLSRACAMQYAFLMDVHNAWEADVESLHTFHDYLQSEVILDTQSDVVSSASQAMPFPGSMFAKSDDLSQAWVYAQLLMQGIAEQRPKLDEMIGEAATNWSLGRMSLVDRAILRLATFEIAFQESVPAASAINDAIELAKVYGEADSQRFVNGVLDRIRMNLGRPTSQAKAAAHKKRALPDKEQ